MRWLAVLVAFVGCGSDPSPPPACATAAERATLTGAIVYEGDPPGGRSDANFEVWLIGAPDWTSRPIHERPGFDGHPGWSPDGSELIYVSHDGDRKTLIVAAGDGSDPRSLVTGGEDVDYPVWIDRGIVVGRGGAHSLVDPQTGLVTPFDIGPNVDAFSFSPDGSELAVALVQGPGQQQLYLAEPDGTILRPLAEDHGLIIGPVWSPTERRIAYSAKLDPDRWDWDVFVLDVDTGMRSQITTNPGADWVTDWSPDGDRLAVVSEYDEDWDLYVMRPDGSDRLRLTCATGNSRAAGWTR